MKITCCKDCKERHLACHDSCQEYQEQKKDGLEQNRRNRKWKEEEYKISKQKRRWAKFATFVAQQSLHMSY